MERRAGSATDRAHHSFDGILVTSNMQLQVSTGDEREVEHLFLFAGGRISIIKRMSRRVNEKSGPDTVVHAFWLFDRHGKLISRAMEQSNI